MNRKQEKISEYSCKVEGEGQRKEDDFTALEQSMVFFCHPFMSMRYDKFANSS